MVNRKDSGGKVFLGEEGYYHMLSQAYQEMLVVGGGE